MLYSWHYKGERKTDDDLLSGFLTAIDSFASDEKGESIKSLRLDPSIIVFEKFRELNLRFIFTTKDEKLINLLRLVLLDIISKFSNKYGDHLKEGFFGNITIFQDFDNQVEEVLKAYALDTFDDTIQEIDREGSLKSMILIEPNDNETAFLHARQYVDSKKISFFIPLLVKSTNLLFKNHFNEKISWILLNSVKNEHLLLEMREKMFFVKEYKTSTEYDYDLLNLDIYKNSEKYVKNPKRLVKHLENLQWPANVNRTFLVDTLGNILYFIEKEEETNPGWIPETISILTSAKKTCNEIYNRELFNIAVGGEKSSIILINSKKLTFILLGNIAEFNDFLAIQTTCMKLIEQLK